MHRGISAVSYPLFLQSIEVTGIKASHRGVILSQCGLTHVPCTVISMKMVCIDPNLCNFEGFAKVVIFFMNVFLTKNERKKKKKKSFLNQHKEKRWTGRLNREIQRDCHSQLQPCPALQPVQIISCPSQLCLNDSSGGGNKDMSNQSPGSAVQAVTTGGCSFSGSSHV